MQIFIATPSQPATAYTVDPECSLDGLKALIENKEFIPADLIRLVNGTTTLTGGLVTNHVQEDDTITMILNVEGGMRKKWRKKRMRRLRRKRRKMRQRAR
uniref:60S ribosomal protein L41 n=1 Tax=Proboscia inermis TaxID=420281 RepID=A0A7S0GB60_9STRA|mmetsp:Transcript_20800/g.21107  ORF Transcript_20800/g.21107 Transcript_20800/m.21107 type:complete len:100 (+) Transcript_20800:75-374(+)